MGTRIISDPGSVTAQDSSGWSVAGEGTAGLCFAELMPVMVTLAGAGSGAGHAQLFTAAQTWLKTWYVIT